MDGRLGLDHGSSGEWLQDIESGLVCSPWQGEACRVDSGVGARM